MIFLKISDITPSLPVRLLIASGFYGMQQSQVALNRKVSHLNKFEALNQVFTIKTSEYIILCTKLTSWYHSVYLLVETWKYSVEKFLNLNQN